MKEPAFQKPADSTKRLFADSPIHVKELARKAAQERRLKARAAYAAANGLTRPGRS